MGTDFRDLKTGRVSELINSTFKFLDQEDADSGIRTSTVANGNQQKRLVPNGNCPTEDGKSSKQFGSASQNCNRFRRYGTGSASNHVHASNHEGHGGNQDVAPTMHSQNGAGRERTDGNVSSISNITVENNVVTVSLGTGSSVLGHDSKETGTTSSESSCDHRGISNHLSRNTCRSCAGAGESTSSVSKSVQNIKKLNINDISKCTCETYSSDLSHSGVKQFEVKDSCRVHGHLFNSTGHVGSDQVVQKTQESGTQAQSGTAEETSNAVGSVNNPTSRSETPSPSHGGVVMRSTSRRRRRPSQGSTLSDRDGDGECSSPGSPLQRLRRSDTPVASGDSDSQHGSEDEDEDDDDAGIYDESYRNSAWLYVGENNELKLAAVEIDIDGEPDDPQRMSFASLNSQGSSQCGDISLESGTLADVSQESGNFDCSAASSTSASDLEASRSFGSMSECDPLQNDDESVLDRTDESIGDADFGSTAPGRSTSYDVFHKPSSHQCHHKRSESISTTVSEIEFRKRYQARTRRTVQRKSSTHTYQRMSERIYDQERIIVVEKHTGDQEFGFHIKGSAPVVVTTVEPGGPGDRAGLKVGDVLLSVNDVVVVDVSHHEVVKLLGADDNKVKLEVAADRVILDTLLCSGYLVKQGGSGILKNWRRRWFMLKPDHCLYYYKDPSDKDPLGAIHLTNYTITKAPEINRKYTFKASKFGQRTYYFQANSEAEMNRWASAMGASAQSANKTDTWLDVSSHNVGLPALSIKKPDCHGQLTKLGNRRKYWKRRYCVLKDACLYYYLDVTSSTAQGVAHLHGYEVEDSLPYSKKFGFTLIPPETRMRTFYFYADNETDKKRWIIAMRKSIGRWVKAEDL